MKLQQVLKKEEENLSPVEDLSESQWRLNHTVKEIKDQRGLASKMIFQPSDMKLQQLKGKNKK